MDNFKNRLSNAYGTVSNTSTTQKILVLVILIAIVVFIYRRYAQYKALNPVWYKNGRDAKLPDSISDNKIIRASLNVEFTYHMFIYLAEWDYNIYWFKPIIVKSMNMEQFCPALYFEPVKNNLVAVITSETGQNHMVKVEDFPIKRWTHLALVVKGVNAELYVGGLLAKTVPMDSPAKQNEGEVLVCPWGGFSGQISKLAYTPRALPAKEIYEFSRQPIFNWAFLSIALKNLNICGGSYNRPTEADLENVDKDSLISFGTMHESMANLNQIDSNLVKTIMNKAQRSKLGQTDKYTVDCPQGDEAPLCPIGTLACANNQRYCYYPDRDIMVSTYYDPAKDFCPAKNMGAPEGKTPFMIGGVPVWERQRGKDDKCPNMK